MKLTRTQQELYDAMLAGHRCLWMTGLDAYYFRSDTYRRCTRTVEALLKMGLARKIKEDNYGAHSVEAVRQKKGSQ